MGRLATITLFIACVFLLACTQEVPLQYAGSLEIRGVQVQYELANTSLSRTLGLMYRESLPENAGMLFDFNENSTAAFWMKNTKISLDMLFIDENWQILHIHEDVQPCKKDPCPTYPSSAPYRYVLEVNGGFSEDHGIKVGDTVHLIE